LKNDPLSDEIDRFIQRGSFPEPFLSESETDVKRWRNQYIEGLIRTDILDFEKIHEFKKMQMVFELLRRRVGSPVSYSSIAQDVNSSPTTINKYIQILEALYIVFRVTPFSKNIARALLKEPKIYFFDNGLVVGDDGAKFENFIAMSLLKHTFGKHDLEGENFEVKYLRTKDGREVDFCITSENEIIELIETKVRDANYSGNLKYFCEKYDLRGVQLVKEIDIEKSITNIDLRVAKSYLKHLIL
jgi:predicted AAA+ superfamily ATPase